MSEKRTEAAEANLSPCEKERSPTAGWRKKESTRIVHNVHVDIKIHGQKPVLSIKKQTSDPSSKGDVAPTRRRHGGRRNAPGRERFEVHHR